MRNRADGGGTFIPGRCFPPPGRTARKPSPHLAGARAISGVCGHGERGALDDDALADRVENDFSGVVQIELLHEIGAVGFDR